jgi:hypothetical protein
MSGDVAEWDEEAAPPAPAPAPVPTASRAVKLPPEPGTESAAAPAPETGARAGPQLFFGSVDEFLREKLRFTYARRVGPQGSMRWAADWWRYPEAISRLDALWRAWEALRLEGTFGMSMWWRDHADHHMRMLMSPEGPFAAARDQNGEGEPLPYTAPPTGMFIDVRTLPS